MFQQKFTFYRPFVATALLKTNKTRGRIKTKTCKKQKEEVAALDSMTGGSARLAAQ